MTGSGDELWNYLILPGSSQSASHPVPHCDTAVEETTESNRAEHSHQKDKAEGRDPNLAQQTNPLPAHSIPDMSMDAVFQLDDFVNAHRTQYEPGKAALSPLAASSKSGLAKENFEPIQPVLVSARSSKHIVLLHEKIQALALPLPAFTFGEAGQNLWTIHASFPGLAHLEELPAWSTGETFHSKSEAKEAASKQLLRLIEKLEKAGKLSMSRKAINKRLGASDVAQPEALATNWIGLLAEYQQSKSGPAPEFREYSLGTRFAAQVTIEGHPAPFGSLSSLHATKKEARQSAARSAVEHFQAKNAWPDLFTPVGGIRKKKQQQQEQQGDGSSSDANSSPPPHSSYAYLVAQLASRLSLPTPQWHIASHPYSQDFHNVSCYFRNAGPHEGPIGEVRNVRGKKKAKEECARLTYEYLVKIRDTRLEHGRKMLEGVKNADGVSSGGLGRAVSEEPGEGDFVDAVERKEEEEQHRERETGAI